ncbi:MAG: hypothetical protein HSCHL_2503 [Hydrogenibacillus schlegelii]|uniref:Uncharacterized protein n=1 Tax=Hydrogenibacillus schlegelii TaxID=1484 RepID=A0A2T5G3Q7_HYDSH|nr:MAG: hypothetical protein HSCHL_2503 [Hydrogenibacillus schlegelii]
MNGFERIKKLKVGGFYGEGCSDGNFAGIFRGEVDAEAFFG